jgi:adenosylhomocysteine nucleosidase
MIGIVGAMAEELAAVLKLMGHSSALAIGGRAFYSGTIGRHAVVVVASRLGKVAAAATTAILVERFGVSKVIFTGLAGGIAPGVEVGDIVIASSLKQHDLDTRPLFPQFEIPLLGIAELPVDPALAAALTHAANEFIAAAPPALIALGITAPKLHHGLVVSGDQFVGSSASVAALRARVPEALAVEMEGAAVAQVCFEYGLPCAVVRVISDRADGHAGVSFARFLREACGTYAEALIKGTLAFYTE